MGEMGDTRRVVKKSHSFIDHRQFYRLIYDRGNVEDSSALAAGTETEQLAHHQPLSFVNILTASASLVFSHLSVPPFVGHCKCAKETDRVVHHSVSDLCQIPESDKLTRNKTRYIQAHLL